MKSLANMKNLGPASAEALASVGIKTPHTLLQLGAVAAFLRLQQAGQQPSLNFLYALEGAITDQHWQVIARKERERLMMELEGLKLQHAQKMPPAKPSGESEPQ